MAERITNATLEARCENLNRRMESRGSVYRYEYQRRNGHVALDRLNAQSGATESLVLVGTAREVADALHYMMVALDDAATS